MALVERMRTAPEGVKLQAEMTQGRKRFQLDMGFAEGGNLHRFKTGDGEVKPLPLEKAVVDLYRSAGAIQLVMGVGAGSHSKERGWLDITAIGAQNVYIDFQGSVPTWAALRRVATKLRLIGHNQPLCNDHASNLPPGEVFIHPIGQFMFSTSIEVPEAEGTLYFGRVRSRAPFREVLQEAAPGMEQGKWFALLAGDVNEVEFRPLRPEGPQKGRGFTVARSGDADVVWIATKQPFSTSLVVSMDSSSYTAVHAHTIGDSMEYGGHIEQAIVEAGVAIMLVKAHEIVSVD